MNEEDLRKFIEFTKTLLTQLHGDPEHSWFFESFNLEIVNSFFQIGNNTTGLEKFQSITESDVNRIKAYLSFIDKKALNYGKVFYQNISDANLKTELIKDFKEMKIALKNDDIIEFGRRLSLQLENILVASHKVCKLGKKLFWNFFGPFLRPKKNYGNNFSRVNFTQSKL